MRPSGSDYRLIPTHLGGNELETGELTPGLLLNEVVDLGVVLLQRLVQHVVLRWVSVWTFRNGSHTATRLVAVTLTKSWGTGTEDDILTKGLTVLAEREVRRRGEETRDLRRGIDGGEKG